MIHYALAQRFDVLPELSTSESSQNEELEEEKKARNRFLEEVSLYSFE